MTVLTEAAVEADPALPIIHITRDFTATPGQLFRAHTDPELYVRWVGPDSISTRIVHWDARTGGSWRYVSTGGGAEYGFHGCFHEVRADRLVQTFTYEDAPDGVVLQTLTFEELGGGRTRLRTRAQCGSFAERDQWLAGGMRVGVREGYAKLDGVLADDRG
jgi:uncharacterized protein YndB with AHSA1/START domain